MVLREGAETLKTAILPCRIGMAIHQWQRVPWSPTQGNSNCHMFFRPSIVTYVTRVGDNDVA